MVASCVGMACGAGMVAYLLTNKNTKKNADALLNTMMDEANEKLQHKGAQNKGIFILLENIL